MKYLSVTQTAERWGISTRRIQILCGQGRVPGAMRVGAFWAIPDDEPKPADARIKSGKYIKSKQKEPIEPKHIGSDPDSKSWSLSGSSPSGNP